ncbi:hypothetical protein AMTRI_Chr04g183510 [Amborella trichopoda]
MFDKLNSQMNQIADQSNREKCRNKGLCYNYNKKFILGHRCKKLFVIEACLDELKSFLAERPEIYLHAISGTRAPKTMTIKGKLRQAIITILKLAEKVGLQPVFGYDVVLETQWLCTLGPIVWDFAELQMKFYIERKELLERLAQKKKGVLLQLFSLGAPQLQTTSSPVSADLQQLLDKYNRVFSEHKSLPPPHIHDHKIPLLPGKSPIRVKPYRYPHHQKVEIEKLVTEMLSSGVIRPSNSPYSSPVILVQKRDGSWRICVDYRALNKITIKDKFLIPLIDELLDELNDTQYFSKIFAQVIIKFECFQGMWRRQHSEHITATMNS